MRKVMIVTLLAIVSASVAHAVVIPRGITIDKLSKSGANLKIEMTVNPKISSPTTDADGRIDVTLQTQSQGGQWEDLGQPAQSDTIGTPDWVSMDGESPSGRWLHDINFLQSFKGRICYQLKAGDPLENQGDPTYVEVEFTLRPAWLEDDSGNQITFLSLSPGAPVTVYVRVRDIETEALTSVNGNYHLQLQGKAASGFKVNGDYATTIPITNGQGSFQIEAMLGASSATLVGFDADVADFDSRIGGIQIEVEHAGTGGLGN